MESPSTGTFRRFAQTEILVLVINIKENRYTELQQTLDAMWHRRKQYHYNYIGLYLAAFHRVRKKKNCFYCSEFVADLLLKSGIKGADRLPAKVIQPIHFLSLPHTQLYRGKLRDYSYEAAANSE